MVLRIGLLTALAILVFKAITLLTIYNWVRLDFYLCLVAVIFLAAGFLLHRQRVRNVQPLRPAGPVEQQPPVDPLRHLSAREWQILQSGRSRRSNRDRQRMPHL